MDHEAKLELQACFDCTDWSVFEAAATDLDKLDKEAYRSGDRILATTGPEERESYTEKLKDFSQRRPTQTPSSEAQVPAQEVQPADPVLLCNNPVCSLSGLDRHQTGQKKTLVKTVQKNNSFFPPITLNQSHSVNNSVAQYPIIY